MVNLTKKKVKTLKNNIMQQESANSLAVVSATNFLAMLNSNEVSQQVYALKKLDLIVDNQWHEISDALPKIESLVDEESFP